MQTKEILFTEPCVTKLTESRNCGWTTQEADTAVYHQLAQDKTFPIVQFCWGNHEK